MADCDLLVTISGAALSLLFYENVRSVGDQVGFLLGETLVYLIKKFTDSDNQVETIRTHINVATVITCPTPEVLYDSTGRINKENLKEFISDKSSQVIGWFVFRKDLNLVPTLRDKILHKQFASYFSNGNNSREELFVTCLLSSAVSSMKGTHKFKQVFLRYKKGMFEPIPLKINNLGNDASRHDGSDYKLTPVRKSSHEADAFATLLDTLNLDLAKTHGVASVTAIQKAAEEHLNALIPQVCETDHEVSELERQIKKLKAELFMQNIINDLKINGSSEIAEKKITDSEEYKLTKNMDSPSLGPNTREKTWNNDKISGSQSIMQTPPINVYKTRNVAASATRPSTQDKTKRLSLIKNVQNNSNQNSLNPFENMVSEMKMDIAETASNKNRRQSSSSISVSRQTCKGDSNNSSVCRSKGKNQLYDSTSSLKRSKRSSVVKNNIEKSTVSHVSEQERSDSNSTQPLSSVHAYNQSTRKNIENTYNATDASDSA